MEYFDVRCFYVYLEMCVCLRECEVRSNHRFFIFFLLFLRVVDGVLFPLLEKNFRQIHNFNPTRTNDPSDGIDINFPLQSPFDS
jgi:hypothetical protein